ncbi:MAG: SLATT domain-containing protein [Desulfuromonadales bacterium]|nr:SLATT domain-containing protein [Desulfuromonadales bacterium]
MEKQDVLKQIADTAYNVGFGAKKHFATYDIVEKTPGWIGFLSMAVGIFALFIDALTAKMLSATFIVLGIVGLYISFYNGSKHQYEENGTTITQLYNELRVLYYGVKGSENSNFEDELIVLADIESRFYSISMCKQILFSDWYAHFKFFWQHQVDWVNEQKNFKFWRDKVPLSLYVTIAVFTLLALTVFVNKSPSFKNLWQCLSAS